MELKDRSGKNNTAKRGTGNNLLTNPALAKDAVSGQPVLRFSGECSSFVFDRISDIRTAIWVVSKDPGAFGKRNEKFVLGDTKGSDFHAGWTDDTILNASVTAGHTSQYLRDGKAWLNGLTVDAKKTPFPKQLGVISLISTASVQANQIAKDRNWADRCWQGEIAEILLFNVELSEADRQTVEKYLMTKYAIQVGTQIPTPKAPATAGGGVSVKPGQ